MLAEGSVGGDDIHHLEPNVESGGYATETLSHKAQMGLQTEAQRKRRSICVSGKVRIRPSFAGNAGTLLLGGSPYGREVCFP